LEKLLGKKEKSPAETPSGVSSRPKREVDLELFRGLLANGYWHKRIVREYPRETGEYISHTTARERLVAD
tara:strand:+ start:379 stop:588 length:210 start_codon:yes stop_codon:yes gene_type:complete